jgi:Fe-S cluster assembly iron-binding protein IscA
MNLGRGAALLLAFIVVGAALAIGCSANGTPNRAGTTQSAKPITMSPEAVSAFNGFMREQKLNWSDMVVRIWEKDASSATAPIGMRVVPRADADPSQHREYEVDGIPVMVENKVLHRLDGIDIDYVIQEDQRGFRLGFRPL